MSRDGIRRRKQKPEKNESSEGALKCICKKKDDRGMMIQCEACLIWQHTRCLGMEENNLPPHYICSACLKPKENLPQHFDFISDAKLRNSFEEDSNRISEGPKVEIGRYRVFSSLEKQLIEKYFGLYMESSDSKEKENIFSGVAMLLNCSLYGVGNLFKFLAEEITGVNKDEDSDVEDEENDPYKDWNLIKKNIYSDGIGALQNGQYLDTDMQEPVKLTITRMDEEWGLVVQEAVEKNQYIAEYLGVWLTSKQPCFDDASVNTRFVLAHPFSENICVDARRSGSAVRFVRRSCKPNAQFKEVVGPDNTRHLALFAIEALAPNTEITVGFDRNWKTYSCNIKCACGSAACVVKEWFNKRASLATNLLESFSRKKMLFKLKYSSFHNEEDSDVDESEDDQAEENAESDEEEEDEDDEDEEDEEEEEEEEEEDEEEEDEPRRSRDPKIKRAKKATKDNEKAPAPSGNMSREERKLQLIMRSIEKMENRERMASMNVKKRKSEASKSDNFKNKRRITEESRNKRVKTAELPSKTATHAAKKDRGSTQKPKSRITSPRSGVTSPRASEVKKVIVRTEKRRKSVSEVASPPPPTNNSDTSSRVSPSSPSPPPTSTTASATKFGKKAWLQEFEEKKQMSKSSNEIPTKMASSPAPSIPISSSASSVPIPSSSTSSSGLSFPLKKKMLDTFLSSTAQKAETDRKPVDSPVKHQNVLHKSTEDASKNSPKQTPSPPTPKKAVADLQPIPERRNSKSADSIPAFRMLTRDQPSSPKPTAASSTSSPSSSSVDARRQDRVEDHSRSDSLANGKSSTAHGYSNGKRMPIEGADAMEIDNDVNPQQNSILYVSPQPPRNILSSRTPLPRSPSPPRTNHSPPQHYASQPPISSSSSPHKPYAPPHPSSSSFHSSSRGPMIQGPMQNGNRLAPPPPYSNGRLQKPPPYPPGPAYNNNNHNSWSNSRANGVIGASGVMRSHDRYVRRSDNYY